MKKLYRKLCEIMEPDEAILNMILVPIIVIACAVLVVAIYMHFKSIPEIYDEPRQDVPYYVEIVA